MWIRFGLLQAASVAAITLIIRAIRGPFEVTLRVHSPLAAETLFVAALVLHWIARRRDGALLR